MTGWSPPALPAQWTWAAELPPWVGRQRELEQLERAWEAVEHGARQVVLVGGEPGAGKSRLVME
ncbi:MAG: ATP-binding protein, partial [Actinomycetales bacterium]|nr:ATP-binding protein [Actinomycetales bacterium]